MKLSLELLIYSAFLLQLSFGSILDNKVDADTIKYEPTWSSLDSRPLPSWYDESKIGIFIHWGVFSVPSYTSEWFWKYWKDNHTDMVAFMKNNYRPGFTYQDFGPEFTATFYNASEWVDLFTRAGARYVVLTSKHHEGFTNWPSKHSFGWNSMDVGPKRDLVGELADAVKKSGKLHFGLYHSQFEFYNPLFLEDQANGFKTDTFSASKSLPELYELINNYEPEVIWSDGDGYAPAEYWKSQEFLTWLYNESPVKDRVVVNDRWGNGTSCKHGGFYNCMDRYNPGTVQAHKWENAFTLDTQSWGYRRNAVLADYLTFKDVLNEVVTTISCGGNVLINVGPTKDGVIVPIMQERLLQLGEWLDVNGDAIYETTPWEKAQNDTRSGFVWYTTKAKVGKLYAIVLQNWEVAKVLKLGSVQVQSSKSIASIELLEYPGKILKWTIAKPANNGIIIQLPNVSDIKSRWGWVVAITFTTN